MFITSFQTELLLIQKQAIFVGGGNSALEMALLICGDSETCIVHRRDTFRADESVVEKVERSNIEKVNHERSDRRDQGHR